MPSMGDMAHELIGDLAIALHTVAAPSREEWAAFMESIRAVPPARLRVLAVTDGGGPSTVQRSEFVKYLAGEKVRIAVMSDALVVRGIVTALSWFTDKIEIFSPDHFAEATAHLDISSTRHDVVKERLRAMSTLLSAPVRAMRAAR
jgi:hypothetical protein